MRGVGIEAISEKMTDSPSTSRWSWIRGSRDCIAMEDISLTVRQTQALLFWDIVALERHRAGSLLLLESRSPTTRFSLATKTNSTGQ